MATYNGSIPVTIYNYKGEPVTNADFVLSLEYIDVTDEAKNQRTVTANLYIESTDKDGRRGEWTISLQMEPHAAVSMSDYMGFYPADGKVSLIDDTRTFTNENDGSLNIHFKVTGKVTSSSGNYTFAADKAVDMEPVPRESLISSSTNKITINGGNEIRISIDQRAATAYHKVTWEFGNRSRTKNASGATAACDIPMDWMDQIPNARQGNGTVTLYTYSDPERTNLMGNPVSREFTLVVPDTAAPAPQSGWAVAIPYNAGTGAAGEEFEKTFIQNFSKVQLAFDENYVITYFGATPASYAFTILGVTTNAEPYISQVLTQAGELQVVCTVTDTRGLSASRTLSISVLAHSTPTLTDCVLKRSKNNGAPTDSVNGDEEGTYLYAYAKAGASANIGVKSLKLGYKKQGESPYTYVDMTSGTAKVVGDISVSHNYDAIITVTDKVGVSYSYSAVIPFANPTINLLEGGDGMGIGAYADEAGALRLGWKLKLEKEPLAPEYGGTGVTSLAELKRLLGL